MKFRNWYQKLLYRMNIDSSNLKKYDIYHKVDEDCVVQTTSGAFLSLFGWVLILILVYAELNDYVHPRSTEHMGVDTTLGRKLRVNFNISFHALTCAQVHMDAMDVSGDNQIDVEHDLVKRRLNQRGDVVGPPVTSQVGRSSPEQLEHAKTLHRTYAYPARMESGSSGTGDNLTASVPVYVCGDCYGAANALNGIRCCNTCEDLKAAYRLRHWPLEPILRNASQCLRDIHNPWNQVRPDEGCRISGALWVNKLAGNLHVAIGESSVRDGMHVHSVCICSLSLSLSLYSLQENTRWLPCCETAFHLCMSVCLSLMGSSGYLYFFFLIRHPFYCLPSYSLLLRKPLLSISRTPSTHFRSASP